MATWQPPLLTTSKGLSLQPTSPSSTETRSKHRGKRAPLAAVHNANSNLTLSTRGCNNIDHARSPPQLQHCRFQFNNIAYTHIDFFRFVPVEEIFHGITSKKQRYSKNPIARI
jgi:hypothetical protein